MRSKVAEIFTATRIIHPGVYPLATGRVEQAHPGDWLISRGSTIFQVLTPAAFDSLCEPVVEGGLFIPPVSCAILERTLGVGSCRSLAALQTRVDQLARLEIGGIRVDFTPGQLDELAHRAAKRGLTVEEEVRRVVEKLSGDLFWTV